MSARALGPGAWQHVRRAPARDPLPVVLARGWRRTHPRPDDAAHLAHEAHLVQGVINRAYLTADDRTLFATVP